MTTMSWKAMGIAILLVPAMASANSDHGGNTQQIPNCLRATFTVDSQVDPMIQYFEANVTNTCSNAVISGTADLIVDDQVVATAEVGPNGQVLLQHLRGTSLVEKPACVVFRGVQQQPCDHKNNDTPGHLRHGVSFPISEVLCDTSVQPAPR